MSIKIGKKTVIPPNYLDTQNMQRLPIGEKFIATEGQTVFNLETPYEMGKKLVAVEVEGVPQILGDGFTETSTTSITLAEPVPAGYVVKVTTFSNPIGVDTKIADLSKDANEAEWTTIEGQVTFVLPDGQTYDNNTKWFDVTVGGAKVPLSMIQMDSTTQFTLLVDPSVIPAGVDVIAKWTEPFIPATAGHNIKHQLGGSDEIDVTKLKNYQEQIAAPLAQTANKQRVSVTDYANLVVNGDWTPAFNQAALDVGNGSIFVPKHYGTYTLKSALTLTNVGIESDGAIINVTSLGQGIAAITSSYSGSGKQPIFSGFTLIGSGSYQLGVRNANVDGIRVTGQSKAFFRDIKIRYFDKGLIWANDVGHIYHDNVEISNNYYGIYCEKNTYDYVIHKSLINGNTFANFATGDAGITGLTVRDSHCGFAPYGIYQETRVGTGDKQFLIDVMLDHAKFEAIGNAAIYSEHTGDATGNRTWLGRVRIKEPGFSFNAGYKISTRDKNYVVVFPNLQYSLEIDANVYGLRGGDLGAIYQRVAVYSDDIVSIRLIGGCGWVDTDTVSGTGNKPNTFIGYLNSLRPLTKTGIVVCSTGLSENVSADGVGYFLGWVINVSRPLKFTNLNFEVKVTGNVFKQLVFDARNGLTNMPLVYSPSVGSSVGAVGLQQSAFQSGGITLETGRYVIGLALNSATPQFGGAISNPLSAISGAVRADQDCYTTVPSTLTVTANSLKAINMSLT